MIVWYFKGSVKYVFSYREFTYTCQWYKNESTWLVPGTYEE